MSIFEEVKEFIVRNCRARNAAAPEKEQGIILYDGNGSERFIYKREEKLRQNRFMLASVADFISFVQDVPLRYPKDATHYRELLVSVDDTDIPKSVSVATPYDHVPQGSATFDLILHEDFQRWFDGVQRTQTQFMRMLTELADQHDCQNLAKALTFLEYKTEVTFEASAETERNYVLGYKEKDGKSGLNIPKTITVNCPVISGAAYIVEVVFDILIRKPKPDDPRILFTLSPAGKEAKKIVRDASTVVTEHELLLPAIEALKANGVEIVQPLYVRDGIRHETYVPGEDRIKSL